METCMSYRGFGEPDDYPFFVCHKSKLTRKKWESLFYFFPIFLYGNRRNTSTDYRIYLHYRMTPHMDDSERDITREAYTHSTTYGLIDEPDLPIHTLY